MSSENIGVRPPEGSEKEKKYIVHSMPNNVFVVEGEQKVRGGRPHITAVEAGEVLSELRGQGLKIDSLIQWDGESPNAVIILASETPESLERKRGQNLSNLQDYGKEIDDNS